MASIKVGFCVSYDWELLKHSLPRVYDQANIICLAVDRDRDSWSCNKYEFDNGLFYEFVKSIDIDNKIDLYEDDFSLPELNARENCNRQRTLIAERMGIGGWHVQVDCDEYFINFKAFVENLRAIHPHPTGQEKPLNVLANLLTIFKKVEDGYLIVDPYKDSFEAAPFATNAPQYDRARNNGHFNLHTNTLVLHESWARDEKELRFKISNWGHSAEELNTTDKQESYIKFWLALDHNNFHYAANFHPAKPAIWPKLRYYEAGSINELISKNEGAEYRYAPWQLALKNNRNVARIRQYWGKFFKNV